MVEDISGSAHEQSSGIEQVNKAVSQMDEMTQQNAALVEQASAAGEAMAEQARKLMQQMAFFTLANDGPMRSAPVAQSTTPSVPVASSARPSSPTPVSTQVPENTQPVSSQGGMEVSDDDDDWEEF
jgi:methyl-accepting chemotaxis protein